MLPSAFVTLPSLPLTPNGKIDRRALPLPCLDAYAIGLYEPPQGEIEEAIAEIWKDLLRVERVGRHDNFFDLGGHSLLATRVLARIREVLHIDVPLRALLDTPTVAQLAEEAQSAGHNQTAQETLREQRLAHSLRDQISDMDDDDVSLRIAQLEAELGMREVRE